MSDDIVRRRLYSRSTLLVHALMIEAGMGADLLKSRVDWEKYPKLRATFEHRPSVNVYWHELVDFVLFALEQDDNAHLRQPRSPS